MTILIGIKQALVRDLWALRLRRLRPRASEASDSDGAARSSQVFSSQSEGESSTGVESSGSTRSQQPTRGPSKGPNLIELFSLQYVGMMLLRIPATVADFQKWIDSGELLYYCASKELPLSMRDRLPGTYQDQLEPSDLISPERLQRGIHDIAILLNTDFGMAVPPMNHPLVLYRWIKELALPMEVFVATRRLARVLEVDFACTANIQPRANMGLRYPEVRLMTLVVISTKLLFPFDNARRYPKFSVDLSALRMDWEIWVKVQSRKQDNVDQGHDLSFKEAFTMGEKDSLDLEDERLDQYLDWYESNIASEEIRERGPAGRPANFRKALFQIFPSQLQSTAVRRAQSSAEEREKTSAEKLRQVQAALLPQRIVSDEEGAEGVPRPGSSYLRYRDPPELQGPIAVFHERAAEQAGISLRRLVRAVWAMEKMLHKHETELDTTNRANAVGARTSRG